jgi:uncharacterized protein
MIEKVIRFKTGEHSGTLSAVFMHPEKARWLLVLAHGAGAGMQHPFMAGLARHLAQQGITSFRYQFPYMEEGKKTPDPQPALINTVRSAVAAAQEYAKGLALLAGGKSLGGRMTSTAASQGLLPGVKGLVFFGFPLHAPGRPSSERAEHLFKIDLPMLFLQGTRDQLADLTLMRPLCDRLKMGRPVKLHVVEGADHSFHVPKKSGRRDEEVMEELGRAVSEWAPDLEQGRKGEKSQA